MNTEIASIGTWGSCAVADNYRSHPMARHDASCSAKTEDCPDTVSSSDCWNSFIVKSPKQQLLASGVKRKCESYDDAVETVRKKARLLGLQSQPASPTPADLGAHGGAAWMLSSPMDVEEDASARAGSGGLPGAEPMDGGGGGGACYGHRVAGSLDRASVHRGVLLPDVSVAASMDSNLWAVECHGENCYPWDGGDTQ